MKPGRTVQYTIRGVPSAVDKALRSKSKSWSKSLNTIAGEALAIGSSSANEPVRYHDLDQLAGTWQEDPEFDRAIHAQHQIDPKLWK